MDPIKVFIGDHRDYSDLMSDFEKGFLDFRENADRSSLIKIKASTYLYKLQMELHFSREEYSLFSSVAHSITTLLIQEHTIMRSKLWEIDTGITKLLDEDACADISRTDHIQNLIRDFREFKKAHVKKEEKILFPYIRKTFSKEDMETVANKFRDFDAIVAASLI